MDGLALLGILLIIYSGVVVWMAIKKPRKIWEMKKIVTMIKLFSEKGTVILFWVIAAVALVAGIWLMAG